MFKDMNRSLGHDIYFRKGLPTFQLDLSDIDPKYNNIIVLYDFPFGFEGRIWDLIVSVPDHCLSFYFDGPRRRQPNHFKAVYTRKTQKRKCYTVGTECVSKRKTQHQYQS